MVREAMTLDHFTSLSSTGESETLEFKAATGTRREAAMTVCAFLNKDGGKRLFSLAQKKSSLPNPTHTVPVEKRLVGNDNKIT